MSELQSSTGKSFIENTKQAIYVKNVTLMRVRAPIVAMVNQ